MTDTVLLNMMNNINTMTTEELKAAHAYLDEYEKRNPRYEIRPHTNIWGENKIGVFRNATLLDVDIKSNNKPVRLFDTTKDAEDFIQSVIG